jgi:hypothetical protein
MTYPTTTPNDFYYDYFGKSGSATNQSAINRLRLHDVIGAHEIEIVVKGANNQDVRIGRATGLRATLNFNVEGVYEIGSIKPQEFIPMRFEGTLTLSKMMVRLQELEDLMRETGTVFSYSVEGGILRHSLNGFDIIVKDKYRGHPLFAYRNCVINSCTENIAQGEILAEDVEVVFSEKEYLYNKTINVNTAQTSGGAGVPAGVTPPASGG